jgi:hypothetical protein
MKHPMEPPATLAALVRQIEKQWRVTLARKESGNALA